MFEETIAERVRPLAAAFHDGGFTRLCVRDGDFEVEFRRTPAGTVSERTLVEGIQAEPQLRPSEAILADAVGIVHLARPPVADGTLVEADRELAYVETLGIRNSVRSGGAGRIAGVYVTDGQPVEYGQPLFAIER